MTRSSDGDRPAGVLARRELLWLAGGVGMSAVAAACGIRSAEEPAETISSVPEPERARPVAPEDSNPEPARAPAAGTSALLLCREAWGARPPRSGGVPHTITRMTIHHTAVVLGDNRLAPERLRQHQRLHQDERGWIDIAYHIGVDRNGNIYQLRDPELCGDTATEYDPTGHFLVLCEGNFEQEEVSDAQLHGAALAFAWAAQTFGVASDTIAGHRDFAATACPGADLYAHVASGELKGRVDDLLGSGPVALNLVCGPEADAMMAGIEAGR